MSLVITNNTIDKYFGFLSRLDIISKKKLISKLKESINKENKEKADIDKLFGAWEDKRTTDEINLDIRESRIDKTDSINF